MDKFNITAGEIKEAFKGSSSHFNRGKQYAKICSSANKNKWDELSLVEVLHVDYNFSMKAVVLNLDGIEQLVDISSLVYTDKNGEIN